MDVSQLAAEVAKDETGAVIPIMKKDGTPYVGIDGKQSTITVMGNESKAYRAARDTITRRALQQRRVKLEPADVIRNRIDLATAAVTDWSGWDAGGKNIEPNAENVRKVLGVYHILEQVEDGIDRHADFFAQQSINSSTS